MLINRWSPDKNIVNYALSSFKPKENLSHHTLENLWTGSKPIGKAPEPEMIKWRYERG